MTTIHRSLAYSIADSYLALPLQLVGTMVISRFLTPADVGVYAVAAVFSAFASTFRDFGITEYLIQEKDINSEKIRAAFTVNIVISWAMGLLLFFSAQFAADFYRSPGVADVMRVLAFNFLLIPFGAVTMAYFRRELNFQPIFIAGLLANLTTFVVATACAFQGYGYMSLAWSSLAGVVVTVGTSLWFRPADFPKWPGIRGLGRVIHFGKFVSSIYVFGQLGKGAPEMVIGRAQDMVGVALFSRASGLVELFNRTVLRAVTPVCLPYFAQSNRQTGSAISGYLRSISYLTVIGWPFLAFMGIVAYAAVRIVYGSQWMASVPMAQILCAAGAIELIHYLAKDVLISVGEVKRSSLLQLVLQGGRIAGLIAVIPFGLIGACWGLFAAAVFGTACSQWGLSRTIGLRTRDVVANCLPSFYIAAMSTAPVAFWVAVEGISEDNFLRFAFGGGTLTVTMWLLALRLFRHPLWKEGGDLTKKLITKYRLRHSGN